MRHTADMRAIHNAMNRSAILNNAAPPFFFQLNWEEFNQA